MGLFNRTKASLPVIAPPFRILDELHGMEELNGTLDKAVNEAVQKASNYAGYVAFDNADDTGGYFGPEFDIRSTAGRIKSCYTREPWVFKASTIISQTLSTVPMKAYTPRGDVIENHPLEILFNSGTASKSSFLTHWTCYLDMVLGGNYFLILDEKLSKVIDIAPVELVNLAYDQSFQKIVGVDVYTMGQQKPQARFPIEQVIHVQMPNPFGFHYGISPFAAAARPILMDRYKNEYEMAFYLRGATYGGVIETTEDLGKSRFQRMMRTFETSYTGRANWWRTLFLPKGATWKQSTQTMSEMQHLESLKENRTTILGVLGIPPSIVGFTQDVNRATSEQQERVFWTQTIVPYARFVASGWNNSYLVRDKYKGKVELRPDFSGIEAVEGFATFKAEKAKGMEPYYTIDEIRSKVWGDEPAPEGKGAVFVAEVKGASVPGQLMLSQPVSNTKDMAAVPEGTEIQTLIFDKAQFTQPEAIKWADKNGFKSDKVDETADTYRLRQNDPDIFDPDTFSTIVLRDGIKAVVAKRLDTSKEVEFHRAKAIATTSQNRIESKLGVDFERAFNGYLDILMEQAAKALLDKRNVVEYLKFHKEDRLLSFMTSARSVYEAAMERGFSLGFSQVKHIPTVTTKRAGFPGLNETDKQAADILRERTRDGRRKTLMQRGIERFAGMDEVRTEQVMSIIEQGKRAGQSLDQIARSIREDYDEAYRNQSRTIVRTEILSAVSIGLDWNHSVLKDIFSEVLKEWMHQGDDNKDARQEHIELDGEQVSGDGTWKVVDPSTGQQIDLAYPRDPNAPAGQVINCRCTMITVIPDNATSNAESIVDQGS